MAYTLLADFTGNTTLTAGTYWMPYDINCNGYTLTFNCVDGPIIIKRAGDYSFAFTSTVNTTNSTSVNKVYWTVKDDDTIGEIIDGSTGSPTKAGGVFNSIYNVGFYFTYGFTATNWEIRYALNKQLIILSTTTTLSFTFITWKYCDYSISLIIPVVHLATSVPSNSIHDLIFDNTNTLINTPLLTTYCIDNLYNIYVQSANTTGAVVNISCTGASSNLSAKTVSYINIYNSNTSTTATGLAGVLFAYTRWFPTIKYCNTMIDFRTNTGNDSNQTANPIECCVFNHGYYPCRIGTGFASNIITLKNCLFTGLSYTAITNPRSSAATLSLTNCCFNNVTLIKTTFSVTSTYNGYYNSGETGITRGTGDFTADPVLTGYDKRATLDSTWATYGPADGYFASATAYQNTGSDTYDALSIDETLYSPCGCKRLGTEKVNPGLYYKFSNLVERELFHQMGFDF
jgi:hypothetical protein